MQEAAGPQAEEPLQGVPLEDAAGVSYGSEAEEEDADYGSDASSDSAGDRREFGIHQCLPCEPPEEEADDEDAAVYAYLRQVRDEALQLPQVVSAPAPPPQQTAAAAPHGQRDQPTSFSRYLAADPGPAPCDPSLKPTAAWVLSFLRRFARLRRRLQREYELAGGRSSPPSSSGPRQSPPLAGGAAGLGDAEAARQELEALTLDPPSAAMPELLALRGQDQLQVRRQLHAAIREVVRAERLDPAAAPGLYALCARVETPLQAGTAALFRQLLRCCAAQRAVLAGPAAPELPHLNVAIAVAGAYFRQDEELAGMWDGDAEDAALLEDAR